MTAPFVGHLRTLEDQARTIRELQLAVKQLQAQVRQLTGSAVQSPIVTGESIEINDSAKGLVLWAADNSRWLVQVDLAGGLITSKL